MTNASKLFNSVAAIALIILACCSSAWAEDAGSGEPVTVRKTKDNLSFQLPPDWPIEKRDGLVRPIPIEEYLARKFKALEGQLQSLEQRLNGLDVRLRVLEEDAKKRREALQSE